MYKRGGVWYISVAGVRQSSRTADRERAKWLETKLNAEAWDLQNGRVVPSWEQACMKWADDNPAASKKPANIHFESWWRDHLKGKRLASITPALVNGIILSNRTGVDVENPVPQNATANGYVGFVSKVIRAASNLRPALIYYPACSARERWLTPAEWLTFAGHMHQDLADLSLFALATGLREANDMFFEWRWLQDRDTWALLPSSVTKTRKPYGIPLNRTAQTIIKRRREATLRHPDLVFLDRGAPWTRYRVCRYYQAAVEKSSIDKITFHGLRHTFASWLAQAGVSELIRSRLGCWQTGSQADDYSHFDTESLRPFSELIDTRLAQGVVTVSAQQA